MANPSLVVCWGGHSIDRVEYDYSKQVGHEMGLRGLDICTGCGPGAMKGPMKGAAVAHSKQRIRDGQYLGISEPGIIAAESPNPIVNDLVIKRGATIAHGSIIHGCEIGENALIGMNAVILDNAIIGDENLVAALALVKSDTVTPSRSLVAGNPAKVVKTFEPHQVTWRNNGEGEYQKLARAALTELVETQPLREANAERLGQRSQSEAVAVRLTGETAQHREKQAAERESKP